MTLLSQQNLNCKIFFVSIDFWSSLDNWVFEVIGMAGSHLKVVILLVLMSKSMTMWCSLMVLINISHYKFT